MLIVKSDAVLFRTLEKYCTHIMDPLYRDVSEWHLTMVRVPKHFLDKIKIFSEAFGNPNYGAKIYLRH